MVLARLLSHVRSVLGISPEQTYAWTDNLVVLAWLKSNLHQFNTFVGNWVSKIIEMTPPTCWRYVESTSNPTDYDSRGLFPAELAGHSLWWNGPDWIEGPESRWPSNPTLVHHPEPIEECEVPPETSLVVQTELPLIEWMSSYTKLWLAIAWIFCFAQNCQCPNEPITGKVLTTHKLQDANKFLYKHTVSSLWEGTCGTKERRKSGEPGSSCPSIHS